VKIRPVRLNGTIAVLFMIGSACFAIGVVPQYIAAVSATTDLMTFVVGAIFFTSASFCQLVQAQSPEMSPRQGDPGQVPARIRLRAWLPHDKAWLAAATQFPGTLFFNVTTTAALVTGLSATQEDQQVWRPDFFGSVLFLVSSAFALAVLGQRWRTWSLSDPEWSIAWLNMMGSIAFMVSAIGSFVVPASGNPMNLTWADSGTFVGALCFFVGAALMLPLWRRLTAVPKATV
jgi:YrhK-like protein